MADNISVKRRGLIVAIAVLAIAGGIVALLSSNLTAWASANEDQKTDDAYLRADVTPLSTKAAGLVASVEVSDYQPVAAGQLLVRLRDEDFRAQVDQAEAAVRAAQSAVINNRRQKDLQDARIQQAQTGIASAEAEISAAEAGIQAANSALASARSGLAATQADTQRTFLERKRQEALVAAESATRQKLEQAVADEQRFQAQRTSREAEIDSAAAQLASRQADLRRAQAHIDNSRAELEVQRRQRAVLDAQEQTLQRGHNVAPGRPRIGADEPWLHPDRGTGGWNCGREKGSSRTVGKPRYPGRVTCPKTDLGSGELSRNPALENSSARPGGDPSGRVSWRGFEGVCTRDSSGERISICAATSGQRDGQLYESDATRAGEDRIQR